MPPTTSAPAGVPSGTEFDGDEFSNNLFSDLAPLLTLFGEQVTKQFLSLSLGWADNILLAMGPLGIMTIVVSAIRVGGVRRLKAIVGRARESLPSAEAEILSSTSNDVCEMWSGNEIVRAIGKPGGMQELVVMNTSATGKRVFNLKQAIDDEILVTDSLPSRDALLELTTQAPNITLNVAGSTSSPGELWFWAILGASIQLSALILPGLTVHLWDWKKGGQKVAAYGYPCFLAGTVALIAGITACSHVIEACTREVHFKPHKTERPFRDIRHILRLQTSCTVADQHFLSYAIFNGQEDRVLRTSRYHRKGYLSTLAVCSTFVTMTGYVAQFIGLRALHWSATIIQLGATAIMTCIRAWVRRGLASNPDPVRLDTTLETAWLALFILTGDYTQQDLPVGHLNKLVRGWEFYSHIHPIDFGIRSEELIESIHNIGRSVLHESALNAQVAIRIHLDSILEKASGPNFTFEEYERNEAVNIHMQIQAATETSSELHLWSNRLCTAVERVMNYVMSAKEIHMKENGANTTGRLNWSTKVLRPRLDMDPGSEQRSEYQEEENGPLIETLTTGLVRHAEGKSSNVQTTEGVWKADLEEISSIMALWVYTLDQRKRKAKPLSDELASRVSWTQRNANLLILGQFGQDSLFEISQETNSVLNWLEHPAFALVGQGLGDEALLNISSEWSVFGLYMRGRSLSPPEVPTVHERVYLAAKMEHQLYQQLALELFSFYMSAIASQIERIDGTTKKLQHPRSFSALKQKEGGALLGTKQFLWSNSAVNSLSDCLVEVGLVNDLAEANVITIPALFQYRLLHEKTEESSAETFLNGSSEA